MTTNRSAYGQAPIPPHVRPGTSSSYYPSVKSSIDWPDGFASEPEQSGRSSGAYRRAGTTPPPLPLPSGGFVPLAPSAVTPRHRRGSSTGDSISSSSKFRRRLSATLGTLSNFGVQSHPHAHVHAEPTRQNPALLESAMSENEGTLRVGAQFVRAGSRRGRAIPPGLLEDDKEELDMPEEDAMRRVAGDDEPIRRSRRPSGRAAPDASVPRASFDRLRQPERTLPADPSSRASSASSNGRLPMFGCKSHAEHVVDESQLASVPIAKPRPRDPHRERPTGNKRLSMYLSQKFSEVGFGSHAHGIGHGIGLPPDFAEKETGGDNLGIYNSKTDAIQPHGGNLQSGQADYRRRRTDGGASAGAVAPPTQEMQARPVFPRLPSNDSGLLLPDADLNMEVSELAKWGGPSQASFQSTLPNASGDFGSASSLTSRHRYPHSSAEREAYFEPPTISQRALLGTQDLSKQGAMNLLGIGADPMHIVGRRAPRRGVGDRLVVPPASGLGPRPEPAIASLPYAVGYEQETLDMEAMLLDSMASLRGGRYTSYPVGKPAPKRVLDIGTGLGLCVDGTQMESHPLGLSIDYIRWPIQQARTWPNTEFVGMDIMPIQVDLDKLAHCQVTNRRPGNSGRAATYDPTDWVELHKRIKWQLGDFLQPLPFDTGTFDMVHISFCGLAIPEPSWPDVLEEAARVLRRHTGVLEIVETTYVPPRSFPRSRRFSYDNLLKTSFIHPLPHTQIRAALAISSLHVKQVLDHRLRRRAAVIPDADFVVTSGVDSWIESALGRPPKRRIADQADQAGSLASLSCGLTSDDSDDESLTALKQLELDGQEDVVDDIVLMAWICEKR